MLLAVSASAHFLIDAVCAAILFGKTTAADDLVMLLLLYNTLAFSTQCVFGLVFDRLKNRYVPAAIGCFLVFLGLILPIPTLARVIMAGLGNSLFHVCAGALILKHSRGKAGPLGIFVSPGAVGLAMGTLWPELLGELMSFLLAIAGVAMMSMDARAMEDGEYEQESELPEKGVSLLIPVILLVAVAVRAIGGTVVEFPWQTGAGLVFLTAVVVAGGKALGGVVSERIGPGKTALLSLPLAAVLIVFGASSMPLSLLGQLLLNLTMPVTLWLIYRAMPDAPALSFGLAASVLWPGTIAGQLLSAADTVPWSWILGCFLAALAAILISVFAIQKSVKRKETHDA